MCKRPRVHRHRTGSAALELALCLPVLCTICFGIIEYGWVFFQQANVIASVRDGARYAVTQPQEDSPYDPGTLGVDRAENRLRALGFTEAQVAGSVVAAYSGATPEEDLTLSAAVPYQPLIGFVPVPAVLSASMTMLLEQQD